MIMMKALVIEGPRNASVKEVPYPTPGPGEVTIQVERTGICGTDFHIYKGEYMSPYPIIPGHEFAGTVHQLGEGVHTVRIGDRVTAEPNIQCGRCTYCLTHRGNHCERWQAVGVTKNGAMAEYAVVPAHNVFVLPDSMTYGTAAFIEPLACVVHAMNRLQVQAGDRALLFGAGAMGQQLIQALAHCGTSELVVVDLSEQKLAMAKQLGATATMLSDHAQQELGRGPYASGFDIVVDATGIASVIEQSLEYLGPAGKFLQFGVTAKDTRISINPFHLFQKDLTLLGSMATNNTFYPAMLWAKEQRIRLEQLITQTVTLEDVPALLHNGAGADQLKVQIQLR